MNGDMQQLTGKFLRATCLFAIAFANAAPVAFAQNDPREGYDKPAKSEPKPSSNLIAQAQQLQETVKNSGFNWGVEAMRIQEAHHLVFQKNGWTSESDLFALDLINRVSMIEPWNTQQREAVFLEGTRSRYGLSQEQVDLLNDEMRRESMAFTMKHFDKVAPLAMEAIQTRMNGDPFTPEMVQKWATNLEPILDEALESVQKVQRKLEGTMDESQIEKLRKDMEAVVRRHNDMEKNVAEWKQGKWTPYDFGLQNDPAHAGVIGNFPPPGAKDDPALQQAHEAQLLLAVTQGDPTLWERYVMKFVEDYDCDEKQRGQALAILEDCEGEATTYLTAKAEDIAYNEDRAKASPSPKMRKFHANKAEKLRQPIERIFQRMCKRLENNVLNREQRIKLTENNKVGKKSGEKTRQSAGR
jgi:hypothetical protein